MSVTLLTSHGTDIFVERVGIVEHRIHGRDTADVPRTDILVENRGYLNLLEPIGSSKHVRHVRHTADVPQTDILAERVGIVEHILSCSRHC